MITITALNPVPVARQVDASITPRLFAPTDKALTGHAYTINTDSKKIYLTDGVGKWVFNFADFNSINISIHP